MFPSLLGRSLPPIAFLAFAASVAAQSAPAPQSASAPQSAPAAEAAASSPQDPPAELAAAKAAEPKPWRLAPALGLPDWFKVSGSERVRYETLDNQFRFRSPNAVPPGQGYGDSEDVLALQTLLLLEARGDRFSAAFELIDARTYGIDDSGFADATMVDTADALQAYVDWNLGALGGGEHRLRVGRETVDVGGRRLMARNAYRNTINAFTGVDWMWSGEGQSWRAFWLLPVDRRPNDFERLQDNDWQEDDQDLDLQFAGVVHERRLDERTSFEAYVFGLDERGLATRRRELITPGFRLSQPRKKGLAHWEVELVGQFGESKTSTATTGANARLRDHVAGFATAALGYTIDAAWQPGVVVSYSYASGDQDPNDGTNERFDTLFGARRWEYGATGVYGAVARANLNSPELRVTLQPSKTVDLSFAVRGRVARFGTRCLDGGEPARQHRSLRVRRGAAVRGAPALGRPAEELPTRPRRRLPARGGLPGSRLRQPGPRRDLGLRAVHLDVLITAGHRLITAGRGSDPPRLCHAPARPADPRAHRGRPAAAARRAPRTAGCRRGAGAARRNTAGRVRHVHAGDGGDDGGTDLRGDGLRRGARRDRL